MRGFCRFLCWSAGLFLVGLPLWGQEQAQQPPRYKIRILSLEEASFPNVTLRFEILDQNDKPATELPQADIIIKENNQEVHRIKPQVLRKAASATVLTVDTSGSMASDNKMNEAKRAAEGFFDRLAPQTQCGLILFHHQVYTKLTLRREREGLRQQVRISEPAGGTAYHDAVLEALQLFPTPTEEGRRAVVLMTDGRDTNSERSLKDAITQAQRRKVQVYTIGLGRKGRHDYTRTVLVLDRSGSMRMDNKIENLQKASLRFLKLMPAEGADAAILSFNDRVDASDRFTTNKETLKGHIESLFPAGETALYDAACEGIEMLAASSAGEDRPFRRNALVLTDGIDNRSRLTPSDVIRMAKAANVRVYMLGLGHRREIDEPTMRRIAQATGGQYFHIEDAAKLTEVFEQLSINLHDDGIDETSLRQLAEQTGGEYYHVEEADKLRLKFEEVAHRLENSYTVTYKSIRQDHDGTRRGILIDFVGQAQTETQYVVHGLIMPQSEPRLYLGLLAALGMLLLVPAFFLRRRSSLPEG
jgi:VWFA-related protein